MSCFVLNGLYTEPRCLITHNLDGLCRLIISLWRIHARVINPSLTRRSYLALMRFAHQCLASQLQQQQQQKAVSEGAASQGSSASPPSTPTFLVPGVYLTLLEGALTRDATSELVAAALQVGVGMFCGVRRFLGGVCVCFLGRGGGVYKEGQVDRTHRECVQEVSCVL